MFGATAIVLIPSPLLEPRYFSIPVVLLRLHSRAPRRLFLLLELLIFAAINAVTIKVFLFNTFLGPNNEVSRFMW